MIRLIVESEFYLDGGAMHGVVPRTMWSKFNHPDERGRIRMVARCTLFEDRKNKRTWIIETGMGNGWSEKLTDVYSLKTLNGGLLGGLKTNGVTAADITDVFLTHLHFDHSSGAVIHKDDSVSLTFPHAKIYVQREQWEWAKKPSKKDNASYRKKVIECLEKSGNLILLDGETELSDTVSALPVYGHTEAMQLAKIKDEGKTFVVVSDLIPIFSHIQIPWVMGYDNNPIKTLGEKEKFLREAARGNWILLSVHDPDRAAAQVRETEECRFELVPYDLQKNLEGGTLSCLN